MRHQTPVIEGPRPSMANGQGGVLAMVVPPEPTVERVGKLVSPQASNRAMAVGATGVETPVPPDNVGANAVV